MAAPVHAPVGTGEDLAPLEARLRGLLLELDEDGAGQWRVEVDDGKVTVSDGAGDADAVISTSQETFEKIIAGEQNPTSAYMTGKLKVKGDMGAAMKLQKLF